MCISSKHILFLQAAEAAASKRAQEEDVAAQIKVSHVEVICSGTP
jgi:hypothetical protein